jgi:putative ABC transport system permease protein
MKVRQLLRRLFRDPLNTSVIVISIAVGMACINPLILFIKHELNTDNFLTNVNRIYLLKCDDPFNKGAKMFSTRKGAAEFMKENFSQVEDFCRVRRAGSPRVIVNGQTFSDGPVVFEASANFFTFFSYNLITNNPSSVLETKNDIAISEELAEKYFGKSSPVGQILTLVNGNTKSDYLVKGVFRKPEANTQLSFDMVKFNNESERYAFLLLKDKANPADLEKILAENKEKIPNFNDGTPGSYYLESFRKGYFDTTRHALLGPIRNKSDLWIALVIGIMIISVASFNYLGLINNKLFDKSQEFYIRRINGGTKVSLVAGFLFESLIILVVAFALSFELVSCILPFFNELVSSNIELRAFFQADQLLIIAGLIVFLLLITLLFSLRKINRQSILLKPDIRVTHEGKIIQIPVFNIIQIAVTLTLLVCSLTIIKQMNFISNKEIGLDKEIVEIKLPSQYSEKAIVFKDEIIKNPAVALVSVTPASPLLEHILVSFHYTDNGVEKQYTPSIFKGDENFINTLGIKLKDGRNFSGNSASDENNCIINESLALKFSGQDLIGTKLPGYDKLTVIGIVRDFNYSSLKDIIAPGIITFDNTGNHLLVRPSADQSVAMDKAIRETWKKLIPDYPPNIESVRERFEWYHRENKNYAKLIGSCCLISLFLSMIGLFAISFSSSRKRTKETGIRKINGATILQVMLLLNKDFIRWVVIAFIIAIPFAFFIMHKWLQNFAYKTELSWWIFASAGIIASGVALITVSWQSYRAAAKNPVESLRYE